MRVDTDCILAARVAVAALVDVITANERIAIVALLTLAHLASIVVSGTLSIGSTLTGHTDCYICGGSTGLVWVASKSRVTLALVGHIVHTVAVAATSRGTDGRQDGRHTEEVAVSNKTFLAETL